MLPKGTLIETIVRTCAHERFQGALLGTYLFLLVTCTVIGKAVRDALFLAHFTTLQMTYADVHTLVFIGIAMAVYFRLHRTRTLHRMLALSAVLFAVGDAACWWAAAFHNAWSTRAIYYFVGTQAAITLPSVSMLGRQVLTTRQYKRVAGVIGSGAILGWIVGGFVTKHGAGRFGTAALLLAMAALMLACPATIAWIRRSDQTGGQDEPLFDECRLRRHGLLRGAKAVFGCPYLRTVAFLVFLSSAVTTIAGLQFKGIASQSLGGTDRFAAFMGSFSFNVGLLSLAIQILIASRVLQCFGIGIALVVLPLALTTGSFGLLFWGSLPAVVFLKGSDHVFRHSIDRAAVELLYAPLSPDETMQAKTFIEAVVCRIGDGVGALAVAFGATVLHLSVPSLGVISLSFLAAWVAVAVRAPRGYVQRLLLTLRQGSNAARSALTTDTGGATPHQACLDRAAARPAVDGLFDDNEANRLEILRRLTSPSYGGPRQPGGDRGPLDTALAAEIVGLYRLSSTSVQARSNVSAAREHEQSIERICRLLKLVSPEHDPVAAFRGLRSGDARLRANALEYLESTLKPQHRDMLVPLLEAAPI